MNGKKKKIIKAWAIIGKDGEVECDFRDGETVALISPFKSHLQRIKKEDKRYKKIVSIKIIYEPKSK